MPDRITLGHDWAGGATLAHAPSGKSVYFQPGDEAAAIDARFDRLVGECGYSGQSALALIWDDYRVVAV